MENRDGVAFIRGINMYEDIKLKKEMIELCIIQMLSKLKKFSRLTLAEEYIATRI